MYDTQYYKYVEPMELIINMIVSITPQRQYRYQVLL